MTRRRTLPTYLAQVAKSIARGCAPVRQGSDEFRCLTCGRVWDTHEDKPECERDNNGTV